MKNICVIGSGHVGLVVGACFAQIGNVVVCVDEDTQKIKNLQAGILPFYEPGLAEMVHRNVNEGRLSFTTSVSDGVGPSEIVFIAIGIEQKPNGRAGLTALKRISWKVAESMQRYTVVVEKSTLPLQAGRYIEDNIARKNTRNILFDVVCNPEFLRESSSIEDFMKPDRIVIGATSTKAANIIVELYKSLSAPVIVTNLETAELIKYASNTFLSLKVSFINAIANICERTGADVTGVAEGMGYDKRIGRDFLNAGAGYGGYCLPKDVVALIRIAKDAGYDFKLLKAVHQINEYQRKQIVNKIEKVLGSLAGRTVAVLGLSFKPGTDDIRDAPSIFIIKMLQEKGAKIKAYDPMAMKNAESVLQNIQYGQNPYKTANDSDALVVITEWEEFKNLDLAKIKELLRQPIIIDCRNIYDTARVRELGFVYEGVGR